MAVAKLLPAGPAAAAVAALAADLAELTAAVTRKEELAMRAGELRERAESLGAADAVAYRELLRTQSTEARERAIDLPLEIAELAAEVAEACAEAAAGVSSGVRWDAASGALLAEAAARIGSLLVEANLAGAADGRLARAQEAAAAAERAVEAVGGR